MDYNNKNISTTKPFSQQEHFHSKTIFTTINKTTFTTRPLSQPDPFHNKTIFTTRYSQQDIHRTIFTTRKHENTKHAPLSPYCPWVSVPSVLRAHPATYEASPRHSSVPIQRRCAPVSRTWKVNATKKTVLVLTVHASKISQTEQNITQQYNTTV